MTEDDEIMAELRQIRAEMLKEFGGDLEGLHHHLETLQAKEARHGGLVLSFPPCRPGDYKPAAEGKSDAA